MKRKALTKSKTFYEDFKLTKTFGVHGLYFFVFNDAFINLRQ